MTTLTDNRGTYRDPRDAAPEIPSVVKQSLITADRFSWWDCVRVALLIIGIIIVIGCAGSAATFKGEKTIVYPDGSTFTQTTAHAAKTIDPSNAAEPGGVDINADGITTKTAATWEQKFTDISRGKVTFAYAWFSLGLFIAAALRRGNSDGLRAHCSRARGSSSCSRMRLKRRRATHWRRSFHRCFSSRFLAAGLRCISGSRNAASGHRRS